MSNRNRVAKMLFGKAKVEPMKVELGLVDDIAKAISDLEKQSKQLDDAKKQQFDAVVVIRQAIKAAQKVDEKSKSVASKAEAASDKAFQVVGKAQKAAKDLGVSESDIKGFKELFTKADNLDMQVEDVKDFKFTYDKL